MSKRLQVVIDDTELLRFEATARNQGLTVSEWVRISLRAAERNAALGTADQKLEAVRAAVAHSFPAPDIEQMNAQIDRGYTDPAEAADA